MKTLNIKNTFASVLIVAATLLMSGCATFNQTEVNTSALNVGVNATTANSGCVAKNIHDDIVANVGLDLDQCISAGNYQAVLAEMPKDLWPTMFGYTTSGHHGAAFVDGKSYRVQWMWAGVTGNGTTIPFKIRLWAIIEGMPTFNPNAHAVIMDARGNNAYDLHGNKVPEFSGKDYKEGNWSKLATLGESTRLGGAIAMFNGNDLAKLRQKIANFASVGRVDFTDPSTGEKFSIATPFNMAHPDMQKKMKQLAAINNQYSLSDKGTAAIANFALSPDVRMMALSAAFVAWDFVTLDEIKPGSGDAIDIVARMNAELERFGAQFK